METTENGIKRENRLAVFEHITEKKYPKRTKFRTNRWALEDSSASESELVIDEKPKHTVKKRNLLVRLTEEPLNLKCEWSSCEEYFRTWKHLNFHIERHVAANSDDLTCCWKNCSLRSASGILFRQHVSYHGYLAKLKNIGANVLDRNKLPVCHDIASCVIPIVPEGYTCAWEYCKLVCFTVFEYYTHMEIHVKNNPRISSERDVIYCRWNACNTKFSNQYKLSEHLRTHTKEKIIGCPTCCTLFSNKTKFRDHRKRQLSPDLQSYQCSQCLKLFPTERLLRDHMRSHINHYKCTMCDMTCSRPSNLAKHMRYKHVKERLLQCSECDKSFVTDHNLSVHIATHKEDNDFKCNHCNFKCRSKIGLDNHCVKKHARLKQNYECHCCQKIFKRGGHLTKHLMKVHNFHWPSGHSRFRYRKDKDGVHRLQTVRYESLEVTQEMIRSESMPASHDNQKHSDYVLSVSNSDEHSVMVVEKQRDVLIVIDDVDEHGNLLKSEIVKSGTGIGSQFLIDGKCKNELVLIGNNLPEVGESSLKNEDEIELGEEEILGL